MKRLATRILLMLVIAVVYHCSAMAQPQPSISDQQQAYDTFNGPWLNPGKWLALQNTDPCRDSTNVMECVREIQGGKLRMLVKSYGATDTNSGSKSGTANLVSAKHALRNFTADIVVKSAQTINCSTTGGQSWAQAQIEIPFFNGGSNNDYGDDVTAVIVIQSQPTQPGILMVYGTYLFQGNWYGGAGYMSVPIGTPIRATLSWDQPNQKFIVNIVNLANSQQTSGDLPYSQSVMAPPTTWHLPMLAIYAMPSNCIATPTSAEVEALFDNVFVDR